tara:strand:+ start:9647 stop:9838 length:192 start_codon:yes stop_codon:yes gene_type:complete
MKMKAKKPFWHAGSVVLPGQDFETLEQHGRELVTRNIAQAIKVDSKPAADKPAAKPKAVKKAD